ncbi:MAG: RdgB/HAM1 family non-canonical purine NTP pyrophosphatase [Anaerolineaceae bacterium]|nr:RdgB/HAM1 family non-canonical purine NTP pyrophosphatase [Anaerolineaceae bacterium]
MCPAPRILVVGTRNRKKCREMRQLLAGLPLEVVPLSDFDCLATHEETGSTFSENSRQKALAYARATGHWCLADDSGLEVPALGDRPGIYSARWGGRDGDDQANNRKLMDELAAVPRDKWQARYVCVAALASPEGVLLAAEGTCSGLITDQPAGDGGFGYDPYFYVPDHGCTMAQLSPAAKHAISHRGKALRALREKLAELLKTEK